MPHLKSLKSVDMTFSLLQETEIGKIVNQLKKLVKDHSAASEIVNEILAAWKDIAVKEAAARKRKREEGIAADEMSAPTLEKKAKIAESIASSSLTETKSAIISDPEPTLSVPTVSIRKDFVNRIADSLKQLPPNINGQMTKAALDTAVLIEAATFAHFKNTDEDYKTHLRQVNYHLKLNNKLRELVALSQIDPAKLATMSPDELISDEQKAEAARIAYEVNEARKPIPLEANCTTEYCKKCHGNNIHVREAQTRSSDEPMTQFFTCLDCKLKWRR